MRTEERPQLLRRLAQEWMDRDAAAPVAGAHVDALAAGSALMEALNLYAAQVSEARSLRERMKKLDDDWSEARKVALDEAATWERRAKLAVIEAETNMVEIERLRERLRALADAAKSNQEVLLARLDVETGALQALCEVGTCAGDTMHAGHVPHPRCSLYSWRPRAEKEAGR